MGKLQIFLVGLWVLAGSMKAAHGEGVDALTVKVITEDADRFAALFQETNGNPTREQLQTLYLDKGTKGIEVFTPGRIKDVENLAKQIAENKALYQRGIDVCLPIAKEMNPVLRSVYLSLKGLFGNPDLPEVYAVFGGANSGGTAGMGAQVIGLEVICRINKTDEEIRHHFRHLFAHETIHSLQDFPNTREFIFSDYLLLNVLAEGGADYIAELATGDIPQPKRDAWAHANFDMIRAEFLSDREKVKAMDPETVGGKDSPVRRWVRNSKGAPDEGWPGELGYWVGRQIWTGYFAQAEDKQDALQDLLTLRNPQEVLAKSGFLNARVED